MTVSVGFSAEEIREFVYEYQAQPHGTKTDWLATRGVTYDRLRRWRLAVFEGDVDRGLIPRQGSPMTMPPGKRSALQRQRDKEHAVHETEVAALSKRVKELEETNEALGKAIGLLHWMNEQEPSDIPTTNDPSGS